MRSSVGSSTAKDADMLKHILMIVISSIFSALADLLRPKKPLK
jgi:hypothetical protein